MEFDFRNMMLVAHVLSPVSAVVRLEVKIDMVLLAPRQSRRHNEGMSPVSAVVLIAPPPVSAQCTNWAHPLDGPLNSGPFSGPAGSAREQCSPGWY